MTYETIRRHKTDHKQNATSLWTQREELQWLAASLTGQSRRSQQHANNSLVSERCLNCYSAHCALWFSYKVTEFHEKWNKRRYLETLHRWRAWQSSSHAMEPIKKTREPSRLQVSGFRPASNSLCGEIGGAHKYIHTHTHIPTYIYIHTQIHAERVTFLYFIRKNSLF
jgi:hypothetical protein